MMHGFSKASIYMFNRNVFTWSLPSGYTCFGADKCLAYADRITGKLTNGANQEFRCYSAVTERFPAVRAKYWSNWEAVKDKDQDQVADVLECMPAKARIVRIHVAGDFFNQSYFDGWINFAARKFNVQFYAFTKSLPLWVLRQSNIPKNLKLIASYGGKYDSMIERYKLRSAKVVDSIADAQRLGLEVDYNDRVAAEGFESFALLNAPNGVRPAGSRTIPVTVKGEPA